MNQPQVHPQGKNIPYAPYPPMAAAAAPPLKTEKQWGGFILATILNVAFAMLLGGSIGFAINSASRFQVFFIMSAISFFLLAIFFRIILNDNSEYLVGKPSIVKLLPVIIGSLLLIVTGYMGMDNLFVGTNVEYLGMASKIAMGVAPIFPVLFYFMYFGDDASGSWTLAFKPWAFPNQGPVPVHKQVSRV